ncbi:MAG: hypothetical protein LBR65_08905 [Culturomica sp.]|nr:hypothetical protein [Culturomica sp.]
MAERPESVLPEGSTEARSAGGVSDSSESHGLENRSGGPASGNNRPER